MNITNSLVGLYAGSLAVGAGLAAMRMRRNANLYDSAAPGTANIDITYSNPVSYNADAFQPAGSAQAIKYINLNDEARFAPSPAPINDSFKSFSSQG